MILLQDREAVFGSGDEELIEIKMAHVALLEFFVSFARSWAA